MLPLKGFFAMSRSAIAVLGPSRYRIEALALSMSAHTEHHIFAMTEPQLSILEGSSTILIDPGMNVESAIS